MKKIFFFLILGYLLLELVLFVGHERILFRPVILDHDYQFQFKRPFQEIFLWDDESGIELNALHFPGKDSSKGIILYFHGNADNLQRWGKYTVDFTKRDYDVLAVEYPGYGKSEGQASERLFYRGAAVAYKWARERYPPEKIIIYGRSLGSGPASWLAARQRIQQLILETPIPSVRQLFRMRATKVLFPFEPRPKFPVREYVQASPYPITIFHGTKDWVVPLRVAAKLKPYLKPTDQFVIIEGGGHKDLSSFREYQEKLTDLLR